MVGEGGGEDRGGAGRVEERGRGRRRLRGGESGNGAGAGFEGRGRGRERRGRDYREVCAKSSQGLFDELRGGQQERTE